MIEFVSYTGEYPNYCRGVLTLRIDGKEYKFGHDYLVSWKTDGNYDSFWSSGGCCGFTDDYTGSYIECGSWEIDKDELPDWLKDRVKEIAEVFNESVALVVAEDAFNLGCCAGCDKWNG